MKEYRPDDENESLSNRMRKVIPGISPELRSIVNKWADEVSILEDRLELILEADSRRHWFETINEGARIRRKI